MEKETVVCQTCGNRHYRGTPCWNCKPRERPDLHAPCAMALSKIIPTENLVAYWHIWLRIQEAMRELEQMPETQPDIEIEQVLKTAQKIERTDLVSPGTAKKIAEALLQGTVNAAAKGGGLVAFWQNLRDKKSRSKKKGSPRDTARDFLIYALVLDSLFFRGRHPTKGRPAYTLISNFLNEQGIKPPRGEAWTGEQTRLLYKRINAVDVLNTLSLAHRLKPVTLLLPPNPGAFLILVCHILGLMKYPILLNRTKPTLKK